MNKKKTTATDIKNPEHYFNKYIAMEIKNDFKKEVKQKRILQQLRINSTNEIRYYSDEILFENELCNENDILACLDFIENAKLFSALKSLTKKEQKMLLLHTCYGYSQIEIAKYFNCSQQRISFQIKNILKKIKLFF